MLYVLLSYNDAAFIECWNLSDFLNATVGLLQFYYDLFPKNEEVNKLGFDLFYLGIGNKFYASLYLVFLKGLNGRGAPLTV